MEEESHVTLSWGQLEPDAGQGRIQRLYLLASLGSAPQGHPRLRMGLWDQLRRLLCLNAVQLLLSKTASFTVPQVRFPKVPPTTLPVLQSVSGGWDL